MFYMLMGVGIVFIGLGKFLEKNYGRPIEDIFKDIALSKSQDEDTTSLDSDKQLLLLEERLQTLEESLFIKTLTEEKLKKDRVFEEEEKKQADYLDQYKLIKEYEKENKSLDEISKLIGMNKGEILLLKSIYKDS